MIRRLTPLLAVAVLAAATLAPLATVAAPAPQHVLSRGVADRRVQSQASLVATTQHKNDRMLYGRIAAIHGNALIVRARGGRTVNVDASDAIRSGMYSAPLFIGKAVLITGYYDTARTIHAQSITREARLDTATAPDR